MAVYYSLLYGALWAAASLTGDDDKEPVIELNPRSSDFGKIRVGNTRIDPLSGLQQATVLLSRLFFGETKRLSGDVVPIRGEDVPFGQDDIYDVEARFLRTKFSPLFSAGQNAISQKDVVNQPVTMESWVKDQLTVLAFGDVLKTMEEQGVPRGLAISILSILGEGVQTFGEGDQSASDKSDSLMTP
jgi:hypothetical protein